jgi:hypothetical protein
VVLVLVGVLELVVGLGLVVVAVLGARARLSRNRFVGVRTAASLRTDEAFTVANRVAAAPIGAAGGVAVLAGVGLVAGVGGVAGWLLVGIGLLGTLVLAGVGGSVGDRAAAAVPRETEPAGCTGSCAGCALVEGCQPSAAPQA